MPATELDARLKLRDFPGSGDPSYLVPQPTPDLAPFYDGLKEGRLVLQACARCERFRYPVAPVCPYCHELGSRWRAVSGRGTIHSWIRYRRNYLPEFEPLMPYVVLCVQLDAGPRIFGRLADADREPAHGMAVQAIVERWPQGQAVQAFTFADEVAP
jgi:uncharacterized OB-fold protein